jgi:hypothetical protein
VTFDNGDVYQVQVTSEDGLGGMAFAIADSPTTSAAPSSD